MTEAIETVHRLREPQWWVYLIAAAPATATGYWVAATWVEPWLAAISGTITLLLAMLGVALREPLGEAIAFCVIVGLIIWLGLYPVAKSVEGFRLWFALLVLPFGIGAAYGKLVVGVWRAFID